LRRERRGVRLVATAVALAAVVSGCSRPAAVPHRGATERFRPEGGLLALAPPNGQQLISVSLSSGRTRILRLPPTMNYLDGAFPWPPGGALVAAPSNHGYRLWRVAPGQAAAPLGTSVPGAYGFSVVGTTAVAWSCGRRPAVRVMDLSSPTGWRRVAAGCPAALSPDAREVAYLRDGVLWSTTLGDGVTRRLLDLRGVGALRALRIGSNQFFGDMSWGQGGIAATFGEFHHQALLVRSASGSVHVVPLTGFSNGAAWQPGGHILAYSDFATAGNSVDLRLMDAATGAVTLVSASRNYGQFAWSPDGRALVVARTADLVAFLDTDGRQLATRSIGGVPVAWTA
jgi:hypothetical protein